jgi:hypothetical protein
VAIRSNAPRISWTVLSMTLIRDWGWCASLSASAVSARSRNELCATRSRSSDGVVACMSSRARRSSSSRAV